jgi:hypothetical protein
VSGIEMKKAKRSGSVVEMKVAYRAQKADTYSTIVDGGLARKERIMEIKKTTSVVPAVT